MPASTERSGAQQALLDRPPERRAVEVALAVVAGPRCRRGRRAARARAGRARPRARAARRARSSGRRRARAGPPRPRTTGSSAAAIWPAVRSALPGVTSRSPRSTTDSAREHVHVERRVVGPQADRRRADRLRPEARPGPVAGGGVERESRPRPRRRPSSSRDVRAARERAHARVAGRLRGVRRPVARRGVIRASTATRAVRSVRSLAPRSAPPCGEDRLHVLPGLGREPLAGQHVRDARRVGGQRLGRDPPDRLLDRHDLLRAEERLAAASSRAAPTAAAGRSRAARARRSPPSSLDGVRAAPSTSRVALLGCAVSPIPNTATITFSPASSRLMSSLLAQQARDLVAARARAAHVDRQPQRVVAVHARAGRRAARRARRGPGAARIASRALRERAGSSRSSSSRPCTRGEAARRVERSEQQRVGAGRLDQRHRAVDRRARRAARRAVAEVQHRRLGEAADDLVRARDDEVGARGERVLGQRLVEREVRAPGLVDDQRDAVRVRDVARARARRRPRRSRSARRRSRRPRSGRRVSARVERLGRQAVRDAELRVELGRHERRAQARTGSARRSCSSARCAARPRASPRCASARQAAWLPCEAPLIRNQLRARAPGLGGQLAARCWNGRRLGPGVDALRERRDVERQRRSPNASTQLGLGGRPALVAGDVEAARGRARRTRAAPRGRALRLSAAGAMAPSRVYGRGCLAVRRHAGDTRRSRSGNAKGAR